MPFCLRVSLICFAMKGVETMIDPAPFFEESVSCSLVSRCLKWSAALVIFVNIIWASLLEENCAVSSMCVIVDALCDAPSIEVAIRSKEICLGVPFVKSFGEVVWLKVWVLPTVLCVWDPLYVKE